MVIKLHRFSNLLAVVVARFLLVLIKDLTFKKKRCRSSSPLSLRALGFPLTVTLTFLIRLRTVEQQQEQPVRQTSKLLSVSLLSVVFVHLEGSYLLYRSPW